MDQLNAKTVIICTP